MQKTWFVLSQGFSCIHKTSRLDGEQMFLPIKIYMKTINIPLMGEISGSLQETVKSSLLENPAGVIHDPMASGIIIFLSTLKHNLK